MEMEMEMESEIQENTGPARPVVDHRQIAALRETGLNDDQICSALMIDKKELVQSAVTEALKSDDNFGPLMEFTPEQIAAARNMIAQIAILGESESTRLRACNLILNITSISAETKYRNAKGLDKTGTINNIMIAVGEAQAKKMKLLGSE